MEGGKGRILQAISQGADLRRTLARTLAHTKRSTEAAAVERGGDRARGRRIRVA
jgi:hypothetical protein